MFKVPQSAAKIITCHLLCINNNMPPAMYNIEARVRLSATSVLCSEGFLTIRPKQMSCNVIPIFTYQLVYHRKTECCYTLTDMKVICYDLVMPFFIIRVFLYLIHRYIVFINRLCRKMHRNNVTLTLAIYLVCIHICVQ